MKALAILSGAALSVMYLGFSLVAQDATPAKPAGNAPAVRNKDSAQPGTPKVPADKVAEQPNNKKQAVDKPAAPATDGGNGAGVDHPVKQSSVPEKYAADEKAIRLIHAEIVKAYAADEAKGVAAHFSSEGEYINSQGTIFHGRAEIEQSLSAYMADHPGCQLESRIDAIRFVGPTVALVDGISTVTHQERETTHCHFAAVYTKSGEKWELASVRDRTVFPVKLHEEQLAQLDFLLGDWIDEDAHSVVSFSCKPTDNNKFLLREFTVKISGRNVMSGSQRIGWDPLNGQLRTWIFDTEGGFAEGVWEQTEDAWVLHAIGVTAAGETATGSCIYKIVNDHTMTWQAVDHEVGGVRMADSPVFTLSRRGPVPKHVDNESVGLKEKDSR